MWAFINIERRIVLGGSALFHDHYPVADRERLGLIVGDHDRGDADLLLDATKLNLHDFPQFRIQIRERLVQKQNRGFNDQGSRQCHSLPLPAGELAGIARLIFGQMNNVQGALDPPLALGVFDFAHLQAKGDVFGDRHVGEKCIGLENDTQTALIGFEAGHIAAGEQYFSRGGGFETGDHLQGCRFAAA